MKEKFTHKLPKTNSAILQAEDGTTRRVKLDELYGIIPFIKTGDSGEFVQHNNRIKFVFDTIEGEFVDLCNSL